MKQRISLLLTAVFVLSTTSLAFAQKTANQGWVRAVEWNPVRNEIAFATQSGSLQILDSETKEIILTLLTENPHPIYALAWSPDGTQLAAAGEDNSIEVWDTSTGRVLHVFLTRIGHHRSLAWNSDGSLLASASQDGFPDNVNVWDVSANRLLFSPVVGDAQTVAWNPTEDILAASKISEIQLWDVSTQREIKTIRISDYALSLDWSPDGTKIASANTYSAESTAIRIWDSNTGQLLKTLKGHTDVISSVEWSPDGAKLVSGSHDTTVRVWDANSGQILTTYQSNGRVFDATFSPTGDRIAYGHVVDTALAVTDPQAAYSDAIRIETLVPSL